MSQTQVSMKFDKLPNTNTIEMKERILKLAFNVGAFGLHQRNRPNMAMLIYLLICELEDSEELQMIIKARADALRERKLNNA